MCWLMTRSIMLCALILTLSEDTTCRLHYVKIKVGIKGEYIRVSAVSRITLLELRLRIRTGCPFLSASRILSLGDPADWNLSMFLTLRLLPRLTPGYIRLLQTQTFHNAAVAPHIQTSVPGMAMLLGAVGIGMCGYSSRQLALNHRPSTRTLKWVGPHTDARVATAAHHPQHLDVPCQARFCAEIPPPSFASQKFSVK